MRSYTVAFSSIEAQEITVEAHFAPGLPGFSVVGLANKAVSESRERIRAAFHAMGITMPYKRLIVNLAPVDMTKEGSHYDLPIALAILSAMNVIDHIELSEYTVLGELGLDGRVNRVAGALPAAIQANSCGRGLICPHNNSNEASWAGQISIIPIRHLIDIINHFKGTQPVAFYPPSSSIAYNPLQSTIQKYGDMAEIQGQEQAKRALTVAAAGGHHALMVGPPGAGKSMLARRLPTILPALNPTQALEVTSIYSMAGMVPESGLVIERPYRDPHHSASIPAMVGGGSRVKPGEISLAHHGVLFLDELPEFQRATLEALRQPLETRTISIARVHEHAIYPAHIQLIAAMNPCPCGFMGDAKRECNRAPLCGSMYQNRLSGPLLDRFDLSFHVPAVPPQQLMNTNTTNIGSSSKMMAAHVSQAQQIQLNRQGKLNHMLQTSELQDVWAAHPAIQAPLEKAAQQWSLSARGYHRLIRVTQTIADLNQDANLTVSHVHEALTYRTMNA